MVRGQISASVAPEITTSAAPELSSWIASPSEWSPVAHAVDIELLGPMNPYLMASCPAAMLPLILGIK